MNIEGAKKLLAELDELEFRWVHTFGTPEGFDILTTYEVLKGADDE